MKEEELHHKMEELCREEVRQSGWLIFNKKSITFEKTKIIHESNIQIIQQLPEEVCFPKKTKDVIIDSKGIRDHSLFYSWSEIVATGIKREAIPMEYMDNHRISVLIGFNNGKIVEVEVKNNFEYSGQVGHLIELYKIEFKKKKVNRFTD